MIRLFVPLLLAASAALGACAPTTQELHLGRIEQRWADAEPASGDADTSLAAAVEASALSRARLVRAVLARNPNLKAARAAWRAQIARSDEKDALPDPVLTYSFAPGSIFDKDVHYGQIIQLSQTIPWVGKLGGRGEVEVHRAEMKAEDHAAAQLELALKACRLFDQYYLVARDLEINTAHADLVAQLAKSIEAHYASGKATLYQPLQAEIARSQLERERTSMLASQRVVRAQLNALLHRAPDAALPPAPATLAPPSKAKSSESRALAMRPELRRAQAEERSLEASIDLSQRDYAPDFTVFGSYNSMFKETAHQFMFGISAPIPLVVDRRAGAERAARAQLSENESRQEALSDQIRAEVFEARARLEEATRIVELYRERLVPLAEQQVVAVSPAFASGEVSFYEVLAAERGLWTLRREWHHAQALVSTRAAELERAMGQIPGLAEGATR